MSRHKCNLCNGTGEISIAVLKENRDITGKIKGTIDLGNNSGICPYCEGKGFLYIVEESDT